VAGTCRAGSGEVSWSSDVAEGTLPLGTILFKVMAGSTLEATPVVKGSWVVSLVARGGGHREGLAGDDRGGSGTGLYLDRLSRRCRKDG